MMALLALATPPTRSTVLPCQITSMQPGQVWQHASLRSSHLLLHASWPRWAVLAAGVRGPAHQLARLPLPRVWRLHLAAGLGGGLRAQLLSCAAMRLSCSCRSLRATCWPAPTATLGLHGRRLVRRPCRAACGGLLTRRRIGLQGQDGRADGVALGKQHADGALCGCGSAGTAGESPWRRAGAQPRPAGAQPRRAGARSRAAQRRSTMSSLRRTQPLMGGPGGVSAA
jgi:hypothetical protein